MIAVGSPTAPSSIATVPQDLVCNAYSLGAAPAASPRATYRATIILPKSSSSKKKAASNGASGYESLNSYGAKPWELPYQSCR
jgi:hypothetical protein